MRVNILLLLAVIFISVNVFGQDINGKLGTNGEFIIRDTSTTFLTLSQSTGDLKLNRSLNLATMTGGSQTGVILRGNSRFIHNYFGNGTTGENTFVGINSGNFILGGNGNQGSFNTAMGQSTLVSLTTGYNNSAFGVKSLYTVTSGYYNSAFGYQSLYTNTSNMNSAFGYQTLIANSTGYCNSALGTYSLDANTTGFYNSAFGFQSLSSNTIGFQNSAFGKDALWANISGEGNSGFGIRSLTAVTTGNYNTGLGIDAGANITTGSNNTTIGNYAQVPSSTGSNQVRIGGTTVTYAGVQVGWTITSDRNLKNNISANCPGLGFISKLKTVSYIRNNDEKRKTEYGFIAQDIEKTLKETGIENAGMITIDDKGGYELRYNDLFAPIVKALQELIKENENLKNENTELMLRILRIEEQQKSLINDIKVFKTATN